MHLYSPLWTVHFFRWIEHTFSGHAISFQWLSLRLFEEERKKNIWIIDAIQGNQTFLRQLTTLQMNLFWSKLVLKRWFFLCIFHHHWLLCIVFHILTLRDEEDLDSIVWNPESGFQSLEFKLFKKCRRKQIILHWKIIFDSIEWKNLKQTPIKNAAQIKCNRKKKWELIELVNST